MKTLIISYSFTGNNGKLANKIARILDADYTVIKETKNRTLFTILIDLLLNRIPPIKKLEKQFELYTNLIFVAPIWFGKIATPLRALFKELKGEKINYSLVTLSAGADGTNPNLEQELKKWTRVEPKVIINPLISEILPKDPKPSRRKLDAYRLSDTDVDKLAKRIVNELI